MSSGPRAEYSCPCYFGALWTSCIWRIVLDGENLIRAPRAASRSARAEIGRYTTTGTLLNVCIIKSQNVQAAVGRVGAPPISDEQKLQLNIQTQGRLSSVGEFEPNAR